MSSTARRPASARPSTGASIATSSVLAPSPPSTTRPSAPASRRPASAVSASRHGKQQQRWKSGLALGSILNSDDEESDEDEKDNHHSTPTRYLSDRASSITSLLSTLRTSSYSHSRYSSFRAPHDPTKSGEPTREEKELQSMWRRAEGKRDLIGRGAFERQTSMPVGEKETENARAATTTAASTTPTNVIRQPTRGHHFSDGRTGVHSTDDSSTGSAPSAQASLAASTDTDPSSHSPLRWGSEHQRVDLTFEERRQYEAQEEKRKEEDRKMRQKMIKRQATWNGGGSAASQRSARPQTAVAKSSQQQKHIPLHPQRPVSASGVVIDQSSRLRDSLWKRYSHDVVTAQIEQQHAALQPTPLDIALHIRPDSRLLHDAQSNHALQGKKLVECEEDEDRERYVEKEKQEAFIRGETNVLPSMLMKSMRGGLSDRDEESDEEDRFESSSNTTRGVFSSSAILDGSPSASSQFDISSSSSSETPIDFALVGREVARRLQTRDHALSHSHLDVLHSLPLLEHVWLASSLTRSTGGLNEREFISFLSNATLLQLSELSSLFQKMNINSHTRLTWSEYLSYLVRELDCKYEMTLGEGTFVITQIDHSEGSKNGGVGKKGKVCSETNTSVLQMILVGQGREEEVGNSGGGTNSHHNHQHHPSSQSKLILRLKNNTVQVFDSSSLQYSYHIPLHSQVRKRRKNMWNYWESESESEKSETDGEGEEEKDQKEEKEGENVALSPPAQPDQKMLLFNVRNQSSSSAAASKLNNGFIPASSIIHEDESKESDDEDEESEEQSISHRSSIRRVPKPSAAGRRPMSARSPQPAAAQASTSGPSTVRSSKLVRPSTAVASSSSRDTKSIELARSKAAVAAATEKRTQYASIYDRKLKSYMHAIEMEQAIPIAQPLSCVNRIRASGHPPPVERATTTKGGMTFLDQALRNRSSSYSLNYLAWMPSTNQLVVAGSDRSLRFYGLVRRLYECQDLFYTYDSPTCVEINTLSSGSFSGMFGERDKSLVVVGNMIGGMTVYNPFVHKRIHSLPQLHCNEPVKKIKFFSHVGIVSAGMDGRLAVTDPVVMKVTRYLGQGVGGSGDATSTSSTSSSTGHTSGVFSFSLCPTNRTILSVGYDRSIFLWDPSYLSTPQWKLPTQMSDILDIVVNEQKNQIIVVGIDQKLRVYDLRNFQKIQETIDREEYFPPGKLTACVFDNRRQELLTAANKISSWRIEPSVNNKGVNGGGNENVEERKEEKEEKMEEEKEKVKDGGGASTTDGNDSTQLVNAKPKPSSSIHNSLSTAISSSTTSSSIISILYSPTFSQILTISSNEIIRVYSLLTGQLQFTFNATHPSVITYASLDWNGKRLVTACHTGEVFMWNFNNGEMLWEFEVYRERGSLLTSKTSSSPSASATSTIEINRIFLLNTISQCLIGIGWSKNVLRWPAPVTNHGGRSKHAKIGSDANDSKSRHHPHHNVKKHSPSTATSIREHIGHTSQILSLSCFGNFIATGDACGEIILWAADTGSRLHAVVLPASSSDGDDGNKTASSPGVSCLEFFLLHDLSSYDSWYSQYSSSDNATNNPPDYRHQLLHIHRAALFVGTDDGSLYVLSPQGLTILYQEKGVMQDAVHAIAVVQSVVEEEVVVVKKHERIESNSSLAVVRSPSHSRRPSTAISIGALASVAALAITATTKQHQVKNRAGEVTRYGLEQALDKRKNAAAAVAATAASTAQNNASSEESVTSTSLFSSNSYDNPFLRKKVVLKSGVTVNAAAVAGNGLIQPQQHQQQQPDVINGNEDFETSSNFDDTDPSTQDSAPMPSLRQRKPFTSSGFKTAPGDILPEARDDELAETQTVEEYLKVKKKRGVIKETAVEQSKAATVITTAVEAAVLSTTEQQQQPITTKSTTALATAPTYRRIIRTHLLIADSMKGSEAKLMSLFMEKINHSHNASQQGDKISLPLIDQSITLSLVKSMYLHSPPHSICVNDDDSTTSIQPLQLPPPYRSVAVFLVASSGGKATMWSEEGEWMTKLGGGGGQENGWPLMEVMKDGTKSQQRDSSGTNAFSLQVSEAPNKLETKLRLDPEEIKEESLSRKLINEIETDEEEEEENEGEEFNCRSPQSRQPYRNGITTKSTLLSPRSFSPLTPSHTTSKTSRPRTPAQRDRDRRLLATPRERYAESFVRRNILKEKEQGKRVMLMKEVGGDAVSSSSKHSSSETLPFAQLHPQYTPETLRVGGLRSAMFLHAIGKRKSSNKKDNQNGEEQKQNHSDEHLTNKNTDASTNQEEDDSVNLLDLFQLAPRDQAAAALTSAAVAAQRRRVNYIDDFLSDTQNLVDEEGQVRDHSVARIAVKIGVLEKNAAAIKKQRSATNNAAVTTTHHHVRATSSMIRAAQAKENVFQRLTRTITNTNGQR